MTVSPSSLPHAFLNACQHTPDKVCIWFEDQSITYNDLYQQVIRWAGSLYTWGLKKGDRVALYLENSPTFLAAYLGTHLASGIVVLVNTQYRQVELRHILNDSGARLCITDRRRQPEVARVMSDLLALEAVVLTDPQPSAQELSHHPATIHAASFIDTDTTIYQLPDADAVALIGYTSGTTGRSKGAMLTHNNLLSNSLAVTQAWHWTEQDCLLLTLPLFHIHGLGVGMHGTFLMGASVELRCRFDAAEVYTALFQGRVTMFFGVPTMYTRLITEAHNQGHQHRSPTGIRLFVSGSAPLSVQTFEAFGHLFGQCILERYGMTETVMNLTNPYVGERRPGTVGQPFPGQEARIVDVQTRQPLSDGSAGEIQVRGPHVFQGYWQRPDATAESFDAEGWFSTGDLGWRSADGYFTISGRARELIISGGYNVYPREVEEVLLAHPAVAEVAVVGLPDPDFGEQVIAVVVPADNPSQLTSVELVDFCRDNLAAYKKPRQILFVAELPRNALGKIQKHILKEQIQSDNV